VVKVARKRKLTPKQKKFCDEYLIDFNATRAYKAAGYKVKNDNTAGVQGHKLLRKAKISDYLERRMKDREKRTEITQDKVLKEYAKLAFSEITDYLEVVTERVVVDWDIDPETGEKEPIWEIKQFLLLKDTKDIPKEKLAAIQSMKHGRYGLEFTLHDKKGSLDSIGKHLGMFIERREINGNLNVNNPLEGLTTEEIRQLIADED
jgi:phage terminase small subunit